MRGVPNAPGPSLTLGLLWPSHQWCHKSRASPLVPMVFRALLKERCATFTHRYDQLSYSINFNAIPNFLQFLPQVLLVSGFFLKHSHTMIYFIPKVFYEIQVKRLSQIPNELKLLCQQPLCNILRSMFEVIVVLEKNILHS